MIGLTGQAFGKPALSARIVSQSKSGTTVTATLQVTDGGTGAAQQVWINQIALRTLSGMGPVTLSGPPLPVSVGNLAIQGSTNVTLTLNVPATVTKFSLTEKGTLQNIAGGSFNFGVAEVMYP
jgi:von Willebrand factor A domain-containing protein 7